ncbi:carboxypeptidase O, partial [Aplysia californica]|uniref:Carboxypeptidase O n=1 Tax=Aplysia californica TaxID=6500 RepID=A0ABM1A8F2_APLCA
MWRKNRRYIRPTCTGVDLNRNFDSRFGTVGVSSNCGSDIYPGERAFTEPETANMRELVYSLQGELVSYLSVHSYSQFLLVPWGNVEYVSRPTNSMELDRV